MKRQFTPAYPAELRERGVRLFRENRADYASDTAACGAIAPKLGCSPDSLLVWRPQAERDSGQRAGLTSARPSSLPAAKAAVRFIANITANWPFAEPALSPAQSLARSGQFSWLILK